MNRWRELESLGQSLWLDYIRRDLLTSGELERLIEEDGLCGMTSNPTIFEMAIGGTDLYDDSLKRAAGMPEATTPRIYEALVVEEIQRAAAILEPVHLATGGRDGYVSLEVSPHLARDTDGSIEEGRRLWKAVSRENLMIKIPGSPEGMPAIETLIAEGINVNVTLLFSQEAYETAAEAYIRGVERFVEAGGNAGRLASVASFFVSRIDTMVDELLEKGMREAPDESERDRLGALRGKMAIANAKLAYERYRRIFSSERWAALEAKGARGQRVLWASTSTKNPEYRDVLYVEELIGPETVTTVPPETLDAFRDHGEVRASLVEDVEEARSVYREIERAGVSMEEVTDSLLEEGIEKFAKPYDRLLETIATAARSIESAS